MVQFAINLLHAVHLECFVCAKCRSLHVKLLGSCCESGTIFQPFRWRMFDVSFLQLSFSDENPFKGQSAAVIFDFSTRHFTGGTQGTSMFSSVRLDSATDFAPVERTVMRSLSSMFT